MFDEYNEATQGDAALLQQLGAALTAARLRQNWTQAELAARAGVGKRTVERIESGGSSTTVNLIRVLRALGLLGVLAELEESAAPRPLEQLRAERRVRRRASSARQRDGGEQPGPFRWGDEPPGGTS